MGQSFSSLSDAGSSSNGFFLFARDLLFHFPQIREITVSKIQRAGENVFSSFARLLQFLIAPREISYLRERHLIFRLFETWMD